MTLTDVRARADVAVSIANQRQRAIGDGLLCSSGTRGAREVRRVASDWGQARTRRKDTGVNLGRMSSAALMLSGIAGVVAPERVASALQLTPASSRGIAETRAGLGGTYAALGGWALVSRSRTADVAVGAAWLGAAAARLASLAIDRPRTDATFWAYLVAEVGFGAMALAAARDPITGAAPAVKHD